MVDTSLARAEASDHARPPSPSRGHLPGLDGLRGLAVLAVMLYHAGDGQTTTFSWARGGWLGVSTFFVLSGFLITRLLLVERAATGRVALSAFWARRAKRLLPALGVAVVAIMALTMLRLLPPDTDLGGQLVAVILYAKNLHTLWWHGAGGIVTGHLWSLSIEEQFYVVLPLLFVVCRRVGRWWPMVATCSVLAVASVATARQFSIQQNLDAAYLSTPARASELLVGVLLAHLTTTQRFERVRASEAGRGALQLAGAVGIGVIAMLWSAGRVGLDTEYATANVNALASALIVASCLVPGPVTWLLARPPIRWVGRVSYSAYLYHLPIFFLLTTSRLHVHGKVTASLVQVAAVLVLAGLSRRYVEAPVRTWAPRQHLLISTIGISSAVLIVLALVLPFPTPHRKVDRAAPTGSEWFTANNVLARTSPFGISLVGDQSVLQAIPGLQGVVRAAPGRWWVAVHAVPDCPLIRVGAVALAGTRVLESTDCSRDRFYLAANLVRDAASNVVVTMSVLDVADTLDTSDGTWVHLGDPDFTARQSARVRQLVGRLAARTDRVDWYLLDAGTAAAELEATARRSGTWRTVTALPGWAPVPAAPSDAELRRRVDLLNGLITRAARKYHHIHVHPALRHDTLDRLGWDEILR